MYRSKTTAGVARTAVFASLLALTFAPLASGQNPDRDPPETGLSASFPGLGGKVFQAGRRIEINWSLKGKEVSNLEANPWGECELYFSPNGGNTWTRITPNLNVSRRSHEWTVPNIPTTEAVIALQVGIEGEGDFFFFQSEAFTIRAGRGGQ